MKQQILVSIIALATFSAGSCRLTAQAYAKLDFRCLDIPFGLHSVNQQIATIHCHNGVVNTDTIPQPCTEGFYEENKYWLKTRYYTWPDAQQHAQYRFDSILLRMGNLFVPQGARYLELYRANLWYYFTASTNMVQRLSVRVKDLSGGGVNIGTRLNVGPAYYPSLEALDGLEIDGVTFQFSGDVLRAEGPLERLFLGGEHLCVGAMEFNGTTSAPSPSTTTPFKVWPNPVHDQLLLEAALPPGSTLRLANAFGQTVLSQQVRGSQDVILMDALPNGPYLLYVEHEGQRLLYTTIIKQ